MMTPSDYIYCWQKAKVALGSDGKPDPKRLKVLDYVTKVALTNQALYKPVETASGVPWPIIAALHFRESDQNFKCHLHNGDPLTARTVHEPKGRPVHGMPPFAWTDSAIDALSLEWHPAHWDLPGALEFIERYNGTGYEARHVMTPYLWDYTDQYSHGMYVSDGEYDPNKVENRPGCVAILKTLAAKGVPLAFAPQNFGDSGLH